MPGMYGDDPNRITMNYNPARGGFGSLAGGPFNFPKPESYATPGIGDGLREQPPMLAAMPQEMATWSPQPVDAEKKPGAWSKGGRAWQIIGIIGDALQAAGGGKGTFMPAFLDMQEQTRKEKERLQQLQAAAQAGQGLGLTPAQIAAVQAGVAKISDFKPTNNDTINDFNWYKSLSRAERKLYREMKPVYRQGPDGQFYAIDIAPPENEDTDGLTLMTDDEIRARGLNPGGPTQPASGGFR